MTKIEELVEYRFPATHLRAVKRCAHGRVEVWAVEEGHVKWWCRSCGEEREFTKATWPYEWEKLNDLFLCYDCHLFLEGETLND